MDIQVRCGFCGKSNVSSAFSCSGCSMPLIPDDLGFDALVATAEPAALVPAAPVDAPAPLAPPRPLGPYTGPAKPSAPEVDEEPPAESAADPSANGTTAPLPGYRIGGNVIAGRSEAEATAPLRPMRDPNRIVWRWQHVIALALLAWGIPLAIELRLGVDRSLEALLNRGLAVQIVGYLVAGFLLAGLVWKRQEGDWSTVGLGHDVRQGRIDALRGFGFGLAIFLGYLPVGLFTNGRTSLDPLVALLLGNTNGMGLVLTGAVVVVGAPLVEEVFFRGVMYEKLARRFPQIAIVATSVLFMLAHGGIIFQIFFLGLLFALKRSKGESVWFTIGAHSAWNASVLVVGIVMLTTSAVNFTSSSGEYELRYSRDWQREEAMEMSLPQGKIDLALASPNGSIMGVVAIPNVPALGGGDSKRFLNRIPSTVSGGGGTATDIHVEPATFPGASEAYDVTATISVQGLNMEYRLMAARPTGSSNLYVFMFMCPHVSCDTASVDYEKMLDSVRFL